MFSTRPKSILGPWNRKSVFSASSHASSFELTFAQDPAVTNHPNSIICLGTVEELLARESVPQE